MKPLSKIAIAELEKAREVIGTKDEAPHCPRCHDTGFEQYREGGYVNSRRCDHVVDDENMDMF